MIEGMIGLAMKAVLLVVMKWNKISAAVLSVD